MTFIPKHWLALSLCVVATQTLAATYSLPSLTESLVGQIHETTIGPDDTITRLGQRYDLGFNAIATANPQFNVEQGFPIGAYVKIPSQHLLPNQPRIGIVVNLPEMRLYYFREGKVSTYPIGIGKIGKTIPIAKTLITRKKIDPTWVPTKNIRDYNLQQGIVLPKAMPAGPDNPLGRYAIYMRIPTYLIHSTIYPESVGKRASFGCIRMYENDIEDFFPAVEKNLPVTIVNEPTKLGMQGEQLFMEVHTPLEEHMTDSANLAGMVQLVKEHADRDELLIDWQAIAYLEKERDGLPHEIGRRF